MKTLVATPDPDKPNESPFDTIRRARPDGTEYRSARELMPLLGYAQWRRFADAVEQARAVVAAEHGNQAADQAFCQYRQDRTGGAPREDYRLSRHAAYLTAMRGDSRKPEIRAALIYFAVKTREAEMQAERPMTELELAHRYIAALEREQRLSAANAQLADRVAEMAPKAEGYDDLIAADGYLDMGAVAKVLAPVTGGIGRTRFLNLLRGMGVIMQASTLPYQHLIDRGYFAVRTQVAAAGAHPYTVVTPKGLRWLHAELREDKPTLDHGDSPELPAGDSEPPEIES